MPKKLLNFLLIGLDFVSDKNGNLYFLEANSFPGTGTLKSNRYQPLSKLCKILNLKKYKNIINIHSSRFFKKNRSNALFRYQTMKKATGKARLCIIDEDKINTTDKLIDIKHKPITEGIIFTYYKNIKNRFFNNSKFFIINSPVISTISLNKELCSRIVKKARNFRVPKTFMVENKTAIKKIIRTNNLFPCIIKPINGSQGEHTKVLRHLGHLKQVKIDIKKTGPLILQELIETPKKNNLFWDIRTIMVNGQYCGGIIRQSKKSICNLHQGGIKKPIPKTMETNLKKASEECIKLLENYYNKNINSLTLDKNNKILHN